MVFTILMSFVQAYAYDFEVDGLYYTADLSNMCATVVAGDNKYEGDIIIPSKVTYKNREFTVTAIDGAFKGCASLTSISIPDEVTTLGNESFYGCSVLSSVNGMHNIAEILNNCFNGCESLQILTLPDKLNKIGDSAFRSCTSIKEITIPQTVTEIGSYAFASCVNLEQINLPDILATISEGLFDSCQSLNAIQLPLGINALGKYSFRNCKSLTEIKIPSGVEVIDEDTFQDCTSLSNLVIADSSSTIKIVNHKYSKYSSYYETNIYYYDPAFKSCPLKKIYLGRNVSPQPRYSDISGDKYEDCFYGQGTLEELIISSHVTWIHRRAFMGSSKLRSITIPNSVTGIGENAFVGSGLSSIIIQDGYSSISINNMYYSFANCEEVYIGRNVSSYRFPTRLKKISIGDYVNNINSDTDFSGCPNLQYIKFGARIATIPDLSKNTNLSQLLVSSTVPPTASPFSNSQYMNLSVEVPPGSVDLYKNAPIWQDFWELKGNNDLLTTIEDNGILYHIEEDRKLTVIKNSTGYSGDVVIPAEITYNGITYTVTSIGEGLSGSEGLISVTLPKSIEKLTNGCFKGCSGLTNVTFGGEVTEIPANAFQNCSSLTEFEGPLVNLIGKNAFKNCTSLQRASFSPSITSFPANLFENCSQLVFEELPVFIIGEECFKNCTSIVNLKLPNINTIEDSAFDGCSSLETIQFGPNLSKLGKYAFCDCSRLANISLPGSLESIGKSPFSSCRSLTELRFEDGDAPLVFPEGYSDGKVSDVKTVDGKKVYFSIEYYNSIFNGLGIERLYIGRNLSDSRRYTISEDLGKYEVVVYDSPFRNLPSLTELTIGEDVTVLGPQTEIITQIDLSCGSNNFMECKKLSKVSVMSPVPPTGVGFSSWTYENASLIVPQQSILQYQQAEGWREFKRYVIPATEIKLNEEVISIAVSEQYQLTVTILPEDVTAKEVAWSSSDESVATVDNTGLVTIVGEGSCKIYAKTTDGSDLTAECVVTGVAGIVDVISDGKPIVVYGIDGRLILENASYDEFKKLQKGLYIVNGKKIFKTN